MRIEAYSQVQQLYKAQKVNSYNKVSKANQISDQLQISSVGKEIQMAKAAVAAAPDIREDVTAPIKEKVQNGTYQVDTASFADKLLAKYAEER